MDLNTIYFGGPRVGRWVASKCQTRNKLSEATSIRMHSEGFSEQRTLAFQKDGNRFTCIIVSNSFLLLLVRHLLLVAMHLLLIASCYC